MPLGDLSPNNEISGASETSVGNSTTTPLASAATFTGTGEQNNFPQLGVMLKTDNSGTLFFDFSNDGTNWDSSFPVAGFKIAANIPEFHTAVKLGRYFRLRLVNNTGAQTFLRLTTYYGMNFIPSVAPLNQSIGRDADATVTRSTITQDDINLGLYSGVEPFTKFGFKTALDSADGESTVWAYTGGDHTPMTTTSTFSIAFTDTTDGASTTGATELSFSYIDSDGLHAHSTHTLSGTSPDTTSFSGLGINRVSVSASGSANYNTNNITITETTGSTVQAIVPALTSVTQQCIYHVASTGKAIVKFLKINALRISGGGGGSPIITIKAYVFNRTVATRYEVFRHSIDTAVDNSLLIVEPIGFTLQATDVLTFIAETDTNNTEVSLRFSLNEYEDN